MKRRQLLAAAMAALADLPAFRVGREPGAALGRVRGRGFVKTPAFYRHDLGCHHAPGHGGRLHEPSGDAEGNLWTSPLDGRLWRYYAPTGKLEVLDLQDLTGRSWAGLHLWPVACGCEVLLCCPALPELWVYERDTGKASRHPFPHASPKVYGGFSVPGWRPVYLYDIGAAGVVKWDPGTHTGEHFPCPYTLSGTLYMTFADAQRREIWGSTYTGNDLVRFDAQSDTWTGHWKSPLEKATPTPANRVFGDTLYVSDHLNGRLVPFNAITGRWGQAIPIPGYREWFGYVSGGWEFRGLLYFCHSTWTGGDGSLDGKPHHFLGSWSVFDPRVRRFSRLDIPTVGDDELHSDYALTVGRDLFLLAVNAKPPHNAVILRSSPVPIRGEGRP